MLSNPLRTAAFLPVLSLMLLGFISSPVMAIGLPKEELQVKLKEREAMFHSKMFENDSFDIWLAKPKQGNACVTNHVQLANKGSTRDTFFPSAEERQKIEAQYWQNEFAASRELVRKAAKMGILDIDSRIKSTLRLSRVDSASALNDKAVLNLAAGIANSLPHLERYEYIIARDKRAQANYEKQWGIHDDWFRIEERIRLNIALRDGPSDKEMAAMSKPDREAATINRQKKEQEIRTQIWQEQREHKQKRRTQKIQGAASTPYVTLHMLHKLKGWRENMPALGISSVGTPFHNKVIKEVLEPLASQCPGVELVMFRHHFSDLINGQDWYIGDSFFTKKGGQWVPEKIASSDFSQRYMDENADRSKFHYAKGKDSYWDEQQDPAGPSKKVKGCPFCKKPGAKYLTSIYEGNYDKQWSAGWEVMSSMARNAEGVVINRMFSGPPKSQLTLLEEVLGYYMLNYSAFSKQCLDKNVFKKYFSRAFDGYSIVNGYGVEEVRVDPVTITDTYILNNKFRRACNDLCNREGALWLASQYPSKNQNYSKDVMDIFAGVQNFVRNYSCESQERMHFEDELLAMWVKEKTDTKRMKMKLWEVFKKVQNSPYQ